MKEGAIHSQVAVITYDQAAEVAQPGKRAFDLPSFAIAPQGSSVVERRRAPILAVRRKQQHSAPTQAPAQRIAVVSPVGHHPPRPGLPASLARQADVLERGLGQLDFRRRGAGQLTSQRNTRAVDHHHPLRALAALGFANAVAPFLAGAKLPSRKLSCQSSLPRWSNSERNARHKRSQTPCSSQSRSRFQQTLGLTPKSLGRSRQRAPVLSTQRIPSKTWRLALGGRPRLRRFGLGKRGSIFCHCSAESNGFCITIF